MPSQVAILNLALGKLAQDKRISALSDQSKEARVFGLLWEPMRDLVLSARDWPWAMKAQALSLEAQAVQPGWGYRYARPADCITAIAVTDENGLRMVRSLSSFCNDQYAQPYRYAFQQAHGDQGTSILTDLTQAWLVYVCRVEDTGRYPAGFVDALACMLAAESAPQIIGDAGLTNQQSMLQKYEYSLSNASAHDRNEGNDDPTAMVTPSVSARW